jgi:hypothetical protein
MPRTSNVSPEQFIEAWQAGKSLAGVAKRLKLNIKTCSSRADYYRKKGVPLQKFPRGNKGHDWQPLKNLARGKA